jgi:hypothetical protein
VQLTLDDETDDPGGKGIRNENRGGSQEPKAGSGAHRSLKRWFCAAGKCSEGVNVAKSPP